MAQAHSRAWTEEGRDENVTANKGQAFMGLAIVLGLAAAVVGYFGLSAVSTQARRATMGETQDVVVTSGDVTYGEKLEKSMLRTVRYPRESVPVGAFSTVDSVVGQTTKIFMTAKEPVTAIKLSSLGGGLSMLVRPGMRAASVEVNQVSGVSGFILPGDRVDMLVTVEKVANPEDAYTQTILQDVEVLAAGMKTTTQDNKPIAVQAVTLLVDPKDAEIMAHAQRQGSITLVLRARDDNAQVSKTTPVRTADLRGKSAPVVAPRTYTPVVRVVERKPAEPQKVTIIRRTSKSEEQLPGDSTGAKR
jgi:pilus assembly protein CpaB